jgi:hypothetical protein
MSEKKPYRSGALEQIKHDKYAAVVVTEEGLEVEAAAEGFRLSYAGRWGDLKGKRPERTAQPPEPSDPPKIDPPKVEVRSGPETN